MEHKSTLKSAFSGMIRAKNRLSGFVSAHPWLTLTVIYLVSTAIRLMLILRTAVLPSVIADEQFYLNLAHSLYSGRGISVYGQPAVHEYFLYPLIIAPLFALPKSINIYQAIICLNCALSGLSVFPIYALGRMITRRRALPLGIAALCMLLPDLLMARHVMVENLAIPLVLTAMLVCLKAMRSHSVLHELAVGLMGALLYIMKPGYISVGAAYCLVNLYLSLKRRRKEYVLAALIPAAVMAASAGLYQLFLTYGLGMDFSQLSIYEAQTADFTLEHIFVTLQGTYAYLGYWLIGFGMLPIAFTLKGSISLTDERRDFALMTLLACLITLVGSSYMIFYDEFLFNGNDPMRIHLRYVCFFMPVYWMYMYAREMQGDRLKGVLGLVGGVFLCSMSFFYDAFHNQDMHTIVDSPLLTAYKHQPDYPLIHHLLLPVCVFVMILLIVLTAWKGFRKPIRIAGTVFIALVLLMHSQRLYQEDTYARDYTLDAEARDAAAIAERSAVYICADNSLYSYSTVALDVNSRCSIPPVTLDSLFAGTDADGALMAELMPQSLNGYIRTTAQNAYDRPEFLVFQKGMEAGILFSDTCGMLWTKEGNYLVVTLPEDGKWIHSGIIGLANEEVTSGSRFVLHDSALRSLPTVRLQLQMKSASEGAQLILTAADGQQVFLTPAVSEEPDWYSVDFAIANPDEPFRLDLSSENGSIFIQSYLIGPPEA